MYFHRNKKFHGITTRKISNELSIGEPQDSTSTSYLAAKAEMEDTLAFIEKRNKERPLRDSWRRILCTGFIAKRKTNQLEQLKIENLKSGIL
ncbi:uncharacterized protein LOC119558646 [Drosophila subpulchrella]|uniref:uncharacterized protein LOC119558646 n=1 Tax=Drosophila subpulchrella TaxID=1486046 RepID=UPI0018A1417E|nr:uncharacterized protein LOC119558646 [Drosophila subpulchrella]